MKTITMIARYLMALMLLVFGANKFIGFMAPPEMAGMAGELMAALSGAGYFMPLVGIIMLLTGLSLLMNKYTALMLMVMAPVTVNIVLFHLFLDPANSMMGVVLLVLHIIMIKAYCSSFCALGCACSGGACKK